MFKAINLIDFFVQWFCFKSEKQVPEDFLKLYKEPQATQSEWTISHKLYASVLVLPQLKT